MKKILIILLVLILAGVLVYVFVGDRGASDVVVENENQTATTSSQSGNAREVQGTVVSVNTDQVPVDGPALVTVRTEDGSQATIAVPSMGINFCAAQANIADVYKLKAGDRVEARGQIGVDAMIIPCESSDHYLRVVTP